jgi:uncharacterized protein
MKNTSAKTTPLSTNKWRWFEMLILLIAPPWIYYANIWRPPLLVAIGVLGLIAAIILLSDPTFDRRQLWNMRAIKHEWKSLLCIYIAAIITSLAGVYYFEPDALFILIYNQPLLWLLVMLGYPLFSVYPQEILYRALFFHRYAGLFAGRMQALVVNAVLFAMAHVLFAHWLPLIATFVGGLLFGWRYQRRQSLGLAWAEHTLYGQLIFTVGLGSYFYHGSTAAMQR